MHFSPIRARVWCVCSRSSTDQPSKECLLFRLLYLDGIWFTASQVHHPNHIGNPGIPSVAAHTLPWAVGQLQAWPCGLVVRVKVSNDFHQWIYCNSNICLNGPQPAQEFAKLSSPTGNTYFLQCHHLQKTQPLLTGHHQNISSLSPKGIEPAVASTLPSCSSVWQWMHMEDEPSYISKVYFSHRITSIP